MFYVVAVVGAVRAVSMVFIDPARLDTKPGEFLHIAIRTGSTYAHGSI